MHRKRGKSARASLTPPHTLNKERNARFTAQHLSALLRAVGLRSPEKREKSNACYAGWPAGTFWCSLLVHSCFVVGFILPCCCLLIMVTIIIILCVLLYPGEEDIDGKDVVGK